MTLGFRAPLARPLFRRACCAFALASVTCVMGQGAAWGATTPAVAPQTAQTPDRGAAYYHYGLAKIYENEAAQNGRQDLATQAIEQYKMALDSDPGSRQLQDGLSNLYFKLGRIAEAVSAAQDQIKTHPDDVDAHELLGRVYLRSLGDGATPQNAEMLDAAIHEYEKIVQLKPNDLESHLLLGQLYGLKHDSLKAEAQYKAAQKIDSSSEEVVLSLARLYAEEGDATRAAKVLADVPEDDRSPRMSFALAVLYDDLKKPKDAAKAYQAVLDQDPDNTDAKRGLAESLIAAGQNDAAAKILSDITKTDPQDARSLIHEADLERRSGKYETALATLGKAELLVQNNQELDYNKALCLDALGRFDEAERVLKNVLAYSTLTDGKYGDQDRNNRALFLDRLAVVAREKADTATAIDAYKQMIALGGDCSGSVGMDCAEHGYDGEIDAYRDAHDWKNALAAAEEGAKARPKDHDMQLAYARQLADNGKVDEALQLANAQLTGKDEDRDVYFAVADIAERAKRYKDANAALDKLDLISKKPEEKAFLYYFRGDMAQKQKMYDDAEAQFRKGLAVAAPGATFAIDNDYGYMLADRGVRLDEAVVMIKKAVDFDPQNGAYLDSLAWAYFKQGQYALAEEFEQKAVLRVPNDASVRDHMGEIYEKTGKLHQAVASWQKSMELYQTSLQADAEPGDVSKVQHKLETARVKLARSNATSTSHE